MAKYASSCKLNYISLGELPVSDDKEVAVIGRNLGQPMQGIRACAGVLQRRRNWRGRCFPRTTLCARQEEEGQASPPYHVH